MKRLYVAVGLAAAGIAIGLVIASRVGSGGGGKTTTPVNTEIAGAAETAALLAGIPQSGNMLGKPGAPVTLVEYADLQCPFCAEYATNVLPTIVKEYVRTGKVKLEFHGLAFVGPDSVTALRTVVAAGLQNRLWNVLDLLYRNQGTENTGWVTEGLLRSIGSAVAGLDVSKMLDERSSQQVATRITDDQTLADNAGINSTPSFEAGKTGTQLAPLHVSALEPSAFRPALDALLSK